jgi:iron(III) transport system ATP-binding protein
MLLVSQLGKEFVSDAGRVQAVRGVNLYVRAGEFYTLLGPSGCGKTTTLQCIAGLEQPDAGEVVMGDEVVFSSAQRIDVAGHRRNLGMVFQSYAIWPHMTVFENVAFPLRHGRRRVRNDEIRDRVQRVLALVQLSGLEDRPAPFLSGGQQQRVALARAVVHEPVLLLLDEPLSNLDASLREEMRVELRLLVKRLNITTVYVTHDQTEALSMSDRIAVMHQGQVVQEGTPREIYLQPKSMFVASFIGRSNFVEGTVRDGGAGTALARVETPLGPLLCRAPAGGLAAGAVVVAIRPESVRVSAKRPADDTPNTIEGKVDFVSFLGEAVEFQTTVGGIALRAKADSLIDLQPGQAVHLELPPERCVALPSCAAGA